MTSAGGVAASRWTPAAIFLVAAVAAAAMSWNVSIWTDEAVTISAATRTPAQLWGMLGNIDAVHGLYYGLMSLWVPVTGVDEFWLRLPSALAAAGTAVGAWAVVRRLATPGTALTAAVVTMFLPRLTWAGIEARPFVFSALAAVWAAWALVRALQHPRVGSWLAYGALAAVGIAVNIYLVLAVAAHAVTLLLLRPTRRVWVGWLVSAAAAVAVVSPLVLLVRSQQAQLGGGGDRNPLSILRKIVVNQIFLGETPTAAALPAWFGRAWQLAAVAAAAVAVVLAVVAIVRAARPGDDKRALLALALPWLVLPTLVVAGYAVLISPIYQPRYFTFTVPAAAIVLALGIRAFRRRWAIAAAAALSMTIAVVYASQRTPFAKSGSDWAEAADAVEAGADDADAVLFAPRYSATEPITVTARRIATSYPSAFEGLDDLTLVETGATDDSLDGESEPAADIADELDRYQTVWFLYGTHFPEAVVDDAAGVLEDAGFVGTERWSGPRSVVIEYTREG